jgi:hypothetical protein
MHYLYATKRDSPPRLVATFSSEQQLLAYVRWATLQKNADGSMKFEQGSPLVGCREYEYGRELVTADDPATVVHNPTPSML